MNNRYFGSYVRTALLSTTVALSAGTAHAENLAPPVIPPSPAAPAPVDSPTSNTFGNTFGSLRDVVLSSNFNVLWLHQSSSSVAGVSNASSTSFVFQPALDYFFAPNISLGALFSFEHGPLSAFPFTGTAVGLQARVGYNLPINDQFSIWPRFGLGYFHGSGSIASVDVSAYIIPMQLFVPVLWHITPHVFLGFGPTYTTELVASLEGADMPRNTFWGLESVIGGHFAR